ncbi:MAG TPA: hypothetical protein VFZ28_00310 [Burkholderiaceae bacterium]|nr:hypothetical protein [Burkholderiaceae bacterium]
MAAHALGIVGAPSNATLGAPLNFPIKVRVTDDESLNSTCVTAEAFQGDQRIPPSSLRTSIEQGSIPDERVVRVYTTVAIDEPVITVTLTLGCAGRFERRFTLFADPPLVTVAAAPGAAAPSTTEPPVAATPARREAAASAPPADAGTAPGAGSAEAAAATSQPQRPPRPTVGHPPARAAAPRAPPRRPAPRAVAAAPAVPEAPTAAAGARGGVVPARAPAASGPRLQLDPLEPIARGSAAASAAAAVQEAQLRVAAMAASAAIAEQAAGAAMASAAAAAERLHALEQGVEKLRADAQRDREQAAAIRSQLARAENAGRMTPWLAVALALLAALALWLWLRVRRLQREREAAWWAATRAAARPPPNPPTLHPMTLPPQAAPPPLVKPEATVTVRPATPAKPAFRDSLFAFQQEPRDVSIEELIDLEQQAEFFVVLGQDEAAIDLLMGHIRSSGGTSPLPYLKLLEIYRRQGDRESYERTRERFNHRFNAYAPDWDSDLQHGRSLDEYPAVTQRLVARWREPLDAMAELEALMFRRDGGELFELPAYREVLFLYSMARDLLDHQGGPPTAIDVLLPLGDRSAEFEPTTARPHLFTSTGLAELSRESSIESLQPSPRATESGPESLYGSVDVDLTKPLPMDEDTQVFRRDDDQRSDFLDLPPHKPK